MSLIMVDSFDHYGTLDAFGKITNWDGDGAGVLPPSFIDYDNTGGSDTGRKGSAGVTNDRSGNGFDQGVPGGGVTDLQVGFAYKTDNGADLFVVGFASGGNGAGFGNVFLTRLGNGSYRVWTGPNETLGSILGDTRARLWHRDRYNYIEFRCTFSATVGSVDVWVNGRKELSLTGVDTVGSQGGSSYDTINFRADGYMDDMYICNAGGSDPELDASDSSAAPGDVYVEMLIAQTGNGFHTDWTPTTGMDHGAMVDDGIDPDPEPTDKRTYHPNDDDDAGEVPEFDAVESLTVGDKDSFNHANISETNNTVVWGVQYNPWMSKDDMGTRIIRVFTRISGTDYAHANDEALAESWVDHFQVWQRSPATTNAWTVAEIDGAEFGVEVIASP